MQTPTDEVLTVTCERCASSFQAPREAVGPEGCKVRCPTCSGPLLVFPDDRPVPIDADPTTVDLPLQPALGVPVRPPGSVPPRRGPARAEATDDPTDAPDPWATAALSVTPPPPRRYGMGSFSTTPISEPRLVPDAITRGSLQVGPPPRTATGAPPRARTDAPPRKPSAASMAPTAAPSSRRSTGPALPPRAVTSPGAPRRGGFAVATQPQLPNRTGPTDGGPPRRDSATPTPAHPMSYAPPWGAHSTPFTAPTATPAPHAAWSAQGSPMVHGTPMMASYASWNTHGPTAPRQEVPVFHERRAMAALLAVVLLVGLLGAVLGTTFERVIFGEPAPTIVRVPVVQPAPLQVLPPTGPRWEPEPRLPQLQVRPIRQRPAPRPASPGTPFSVEASDLQDPWADE